MYQVQKKHVNIRKINEKSDHATVLPVYSNALWERHECLATDMCIRWNPPGEGIHYTVRCSALYITFYLQALEQMCLYVTLYIYCVIKLTAHSRHCHTWTCTLLACCVYCLDGDVTDWTILGLRPHSHGSILVNILHCIWKPKPEVEPTRRKSGRICSSSVFWTQS